MIKIYICTECINSSISNNKAIAIYEEFKKYIDDIDEIDLSATKCMCNGKCCQGPIVEIGKDRLSNFSIEDVEKIVNTYFRKIS